MRAYGNLLTGNHEQAEADLEEVERLHPGFYRLFLQRGDLHLARGLYAEAMAWYEKAENQSEWPNFEATAQVRLGIAYLAQGQPERAIEAADMALGKKARSLTALWVKGRAQVRLQRLADAQATAERMAEIWQGSGSLHEVEYFHDLEGSIAMAKEDHTAAKQHFEEARKLNPRYLAFFKAAVGA